MTTHIYLITETPGIVGRTIGCAWSESEAQRLCEAHNATLEKPEVKGGWKYTELKALEAPLDDKDKGKRVPVTGDAGAGAYFYPDTCRSVTGTVGTGIEVERLFLTPKGSYIRHGHHIQLGEFYSLLGEVYKVVQWCRDNGIDPRSRPDFFNEHVRDLFTGVEL